MARLTIYNEQVLKDANEYLKNYESHNHPFPSVIGLSRVLGISLSALKRWRNDMDKTELKTTLEKIKDEQHLQLINKGIMGEFHASICKLMLHNFGYSDKHVIEQETENQTGVLLVLPQATMEDFTEYAKQSDADMEKKRKEFNC